MADATRDLPVLDARIALTTAQVDAFRTDGFLHVRGVVTADELAAYRGAIGAATARRNRERRAWQDRDAFGQAFLQTMELRKDDPVVHRWCTAPRFGDLAAQVLGVDAVHVYHDQSLFKEPVPAGTADPAAGGTPWHQDLYYWPFDTDRVCGLWIPLVDVTADMGSLRYVRGSHRHGDLGARHISSESEAHYAAWIAAQGAEVVDTAPVHAGDALLHAGWTVHGAGPNRSRQVREAMVVAWFAEGMTTGAWGDRAREANRQAFLDNRPPGALAAGPGNERVRRRH